MNGGFRLRSSFLRHSPCRVGRMELSRPMENGHEILNRQNAGRPDRRRRGDARAYAGAGAAGARSWDRPAVDIPEGWLRALGLRAGMGRRRIRLRKSATETVTAMAMVTGPTRARGAIPAMAMAMAGRVPGAGVIAAIGAAPAGDAARRRDAQGAAALFSVEKIVLRGRVPKSHWSACRLRPRHRQPCSCRKTDKGRLQNRGKFVTY